MAHRRKKPLAEARGFFVFRVERPYGNGAVGRTVAVRRGPLRRRWNSDGPGPGRRTVRDLHPGAVARNGEGLPHA
ncbi:hypothetical protein SCALM49S_03605 [Streptomyces californicus]